MKFHFTFGQKPQTQTPTIEMALESRFDDGTVVQTTYAHVNGTRQLIYRESNTGKWRSSLGLSFNGLPHTTENLIKAIGRRDPVGEIYIMPAP